MTRAQGAAAAPEPPLGVYVHIPFCRSKCPYCAFFSLPRPDERLTRAYVAELARRLRAAGGLLPARDGGRRSADTVYFGGGTPTILPPSAAAELLSAAREGFDVLPGAEITVEGNPAAADARALAAWREAGANRLSLGAQSAQPDELRALGRPHRWEDVVRTVRAAREAGFRNLSLDLMLGVPRQTEASLADTLGRALELEPEHLSAYTLMIEEGTPFGRAGRAGLGLPDDGGDSAAVLWETASSTLRAAGYEHYEISSFARPGFRSQHNLHTWQSRDYAGFGVAAHSRLNGVRSAQSRDLEGFLAGRDITEFREADVGIELERVYVMLALRLSDGVADEAFAARFGRGFRETYGDRLAPLLSGGFLEADGARVRMTERGWAVCNAVLAELL